MPKLILTDSIIYVPSRPSARPWLPKCAEHCARRGYRVLSVVSEWDDVQRMVLREGVQIVVVGRRDHPPADRLPRIEFVEDADLLMEFPEQYQRPQRRRWAGPR